MENCLELRPCLHRLISSNAVRVEVKNAFFHFQLKPAKMPPGPVQEIHLPTAEASAPLQLITPHWVSVSRRLGVGEFSCRTGLRLGVSLLPEGRGASTEGFVVETSQAPKISIELCCNAYIQIKNSNKAFSIFVQTEQ